MSKIFSILVLLLLFSSTLTIAQPYELVVYNAENLFDADGYSVFNDYKPVDEEGDSQYMPVHVLTKIENVIEVMSKYGEGNGPEVILFSEIESDHTPLPGGDMYDHASVLNRYSDLTLQEMLTDRFNSEIAGLPSEILLLKGFEDRGLTGYDVAVGYERDEEFIPQHVQKNVVFSRLPVLHEKTKSHPTQRARPILEVWLDVEGYELVVFANHWKSGASSSEMEEIRLQNAEVLKGRLDELRSENPHLDFIIGGDFNSDYNQSYRYDYMNRTAVNDVLKSSGNERKVQQGDTDAVYNLWYECDLSNRGSDTYRGKWGTLMQIMIGPGLYDFHGIQYADNSFDVGRFPGMNVYENSNMPKRWYFFGEGGGYSDHLPVSMEFTVTGEDNPGKKITLENPGVNDDAEWNPIPVTVSIPHKSELVMPDEYKNSEIRTTGYFSDLFYVTSKITDETEVLVNGETYGLYSPVFNVRDRFSDIAGSDEEITFIGRLNMFRGNWQFVIEDTSYVNPEFP